MVKEEVDCCEHPDLMLTMVDKKIALYRSKGSPDGSYIIPEGVEVPSTNATYTLSVHRVGRRRATAPSLTLTGSTLSNGTTWQ